jgi:hypothetical protein
VPYSQFTKNIRIVASEVGHDQIRIRQLLDNLNGDQAWLLHLVSAYASVTQLALDDWYYDVP